MPWQPVNKYCWDFWFTWEGDTLHVFYLQASQLECGFDPERKSNLATVGHAVLTDYGWQEVRPQQPAFRAREGDCWDNFSIWTGSVLEKDGTYHMFYTSRRKEDPLIRTPQERQRPQNIGIAESEDLMSWSRTVESNSGPVIPNPGVNSEFDGVNWRDPYVIQDEFTSRYYCFICARPNNGAIDSGGVIVYTSSPDIKQWGTDPSYKILYSSEEFYQIEVPQVFWRKSENGDYWRLYLLFSPQEKDCGNRRRDPRTGTHYVYSKPIENRSNIEYNSIDWEGDSANLLDDNIFAGKIVDPEIENNPVFFGFQFEDQRGRFVGGISDPKWVVFEDCGMISLKDTKAVDNRVKIDDSKISKALVH
jgi:beta-fructofuranosidase